MKRMLMTAATSSLLAMAVPGVALAAHHGERHHRHHHARRAHHARVIVFGAAMTPTTTTGTPAAGSLQTAPASPSGETAGTVTSFTGGVLTITLTDKSTVSGKVTEGTEIHCQSATPVGSGEDQDGSDDSGTDDSATSSTTARVSSHDSGSGDGEDGEDDSQGTDGQQSCTTAALVPGAVVGEAELSVSASGAVWHQVDLIQ